MARRYNPDSNFDDYDDDDEHRYGSAGDGYDFADPGGRSSLRAARKGNPRIYSCPTCKTRNVLTRRDKELGYQCNACADHDEGFGY